LAGNQPETNKTDDLRQESIEPVKQCVALYVECQPHSLVNSSDLIHFEKGDGHAASDAVLVPPKPMVPDQEKSNKTDSGKIIEDLPHNEDYTWPWNAEIYVEGALIGNGVVLDKQWILTEKTCVENVRLVFSHAIRLISKVNLNCKSPVPTWTIQPSCWVDPKASLEFKVLMNN
jgi:Domain of unknown function (DUF1986)